MTDAVPAVSAAERELRSLIRHFARASLLGVILLVLAHTDRVLSDHPLSTALGRWYFQATGVGAAPADSVLQPRGTILLGVIQAVLATPIVFWCGAPILRRFWAAVRNARLNFWILIGVGLLASYFYSIAAVTYQLTEAKPLVDPDDVTLPNLGAASAVVGTVAEGVAATAPEHRQIIEPFFESTAGIVVFVLLGLILELRAMMSTDEAVRKLTGMIPREARRLLADGTEELIPLAQLTPGELIRVAPGERYPVDGTIVDGTTTVDESMLTGEPVTVEKGPGMRVLAGTTNGLRPVTVEAVRIRDETILSQVVHLVDQAQKMRVPLQRTADGIARKLMIVLLLIAVLTFSGWLAAGLKSTRGNWEECVDKGWLSYAVICSVAVLIVGCPCALGLATPLAITIGMRRAAKSGVLFRDGGALEKLSAVDTVLFDKTGTLTEGKPWLLGVEGGVGDDPNNVLALAAAVERGSEHAIGAAIVWEAVRRNLTIEIAEQVEAFPGKGVRGLVNGRRVAVGTIPFLKESGMHQEMLISAAHGHRIAGHGVVLIGYGDRCCGLIAISDPLKTSSKTAVSRLKKDGARPVILTGDHQDTAKAVAHRLVIDEVIADALPVEKFAVVERFKKEGRRVAMVGDGINDAPALAAADVGIALGSGHTIAISSAGVTLLRPDLSALAAARNLSRATVRIIRQNLWLALLFNLLAIPVAAGLLVPFGGELISPVWATAAMTFSIVGIAINSLRLMWKGRADV